MPKDYEAIRNRLVRQGVPLKDAQTRAAKIANSRRKQQGKRPARFHRKKGRRKGK